MHRVGEVIYGIDFKNKSPDLARMYSEGMEIVSAALQEDTAPCEMILYVAPDEDSA